MSKNLTKNGWVVTLANGSLKRDIIIIGGSFDEAISKAKTFAELTYLPGEMRYIEAVRPSLDIVIQGS